MLAIHFKTSQNRIFDIKNLFPLVKTVAILKMYMHISTIIMLIWATYLKSIN